MRFFKSFLFIAALLFLFFFLIDKIPLWSSDEGRYGEIAREMFESGDFVLSRFNYVDYTEKPVLAPILSAFSCALFGVNSWSIRLIPVLSALAGIGMTFLFARKFFSEQTAMVAVIILSTTVGYVLVGRFAVIDMLMTFLLSASLFSLFTANIQRQARYYLAAYVFMGLAFLTKGLIGIILPGMIYFAFLVWTKNLKEIKNMKWLWGILILAVIILPWWFQVTARKPEFFKEFILEQHFTRFSTGHFGRKKPFWFFVPILFVTSFPWSLFLPAAVISGLRKEGALRRKIQFLICWTAVILIFFSIPKSKLPYYLLPVSMAVSILIANFLQEWIDAKGKLPKLNPSVMAWSWKVITGICVLGGVGLNIFLLIWHRSPEVNILRPILHLGGFLLILGSLAAYHLMRRAQLKEAVFSLAGMIYGVLIFAFIAMLRMTPFQSTFDFVQTLQPMLKTEDMVSVFTSPDTFSDLPFYLKRRIVVVGPDRGTSKAESLKAENRAKLADWFLPTEEFVSLFNKKDRRIFCLMPRKHFSELQGLGLRGYRMIREDHGKILISN
ncbi:MAG: glycosyltransferase family 39 protein [Candidatus Omnitrophica bacterium]|nr:glycosyltransferase family 39 protein [Candidatus Omnitrophota bacterium]